MVILTYYNWNGLSVCVFEWGTDYVWGPQPQSLPSTNQYPNLSSTVPSPPQTPTYILSPYKPSFVTKMSNYVNKFVLTHFTVRDYPVKRNSTKQEYLR